MNNDAKKLTILNKDFFLNPELNEVDESEAYCKLSYYYEIKNGSKIPCKIVFAVDNNKTLIVSGKVINHFSNLPPLTEDQFNSNKKIALRTNYSFLKRTLFEFRRFL